MAEASIGELLAQSRAAHTEYRQLATKERRANREQAAKQQPEIGALLWDAYHLRLRAHQRDPEHLDPAWGEDFSLMRVYPEALLDFYAGFLDLPADSVEQAARGAVATVSARRWVRRS